MEERELNVMFALTGASKRTTTGYRGRTTRITLPVTWIDSMGFTKEDRKAKVTFDGTKIVIEKSIDKNNN